MTAAWCGLSGLRDGTREGASAAGARDDGCIAPSRAARRAAPPVLLFYVI